MSTATALILAPPRAQERIITGLSLGERARRVAARVGIAPERVHVVRSTQELAQARTALEADLARGSTLLFIRAAYQVVADSLVEPLCPGEPGTRIAVDPRAGGAYAGAIHTGADRARELLDALAADLDHGDAQASAAWPARDTTRVDVDARARHPAHTREEVAAADAWQFELIHKPLDGFLTVRVYRPLAGPLTRMFLRLPFSPNAITVLSTVLGVIGCWIAAGPSYSEHVLGLSLLFLGGVIDCCDGEVARLRLETSKIGGWLDTLGDDLSRFALILGMGAHVAPRYPDLPIMGIATLALVLNVIAMCMIYWYCILIAHSPNSQEYGKALGTGSSDTAQSPWKARLSDLLAQAARRDFIDLAMLVMAILGLPIIGYIGLMLGMLFGFLIIVSTHFQIVRMRRQQQAAIAE